MKNDAPTPSFATPTPSSSTPICHTAKNILRLPQVCQKTGLSRPTIYAYMKKGLFPAPIPLGERSVGWLESSVENWIDSRIATRG